MPHSRPPRAQVDAQGSQAAAARTQSGFYVIRAPYAGVVATVPATLGDMAMPGAPLLTLYDPAALRVSRGAAKRRRERRRQARRPGAEIPGLPASRQWPTRRSGSSVLPTVDPVTHTVQLRLDLPAGLDGVSPGMFARLWLPVAGRRDGRRVVPQQAIVRRAELTGALRARRRRPTRASPGPARPRPWRQRRDSVRVAAGRTRGHRSAGRCPRPLNLPVANRSTTHRSAFQDASRRFSRVRRSRRCWRCSPLLLGVFAVLVTPREEEPQINVTMANVLIPFPGRSARDVEQMVAGPAEQVLSQISGIEHVMSVSHPDWPSSRCSSRSACRAPRRWCGSTTPSIPTLTGCRGLGVLDPIIKPKGIDDVPIVTADAVQQEPGDRTVRSGTRGAQHRGGLEARAGHA